MSLNAYRKHCKECGDFCNGSDPQYCCLEFHQGRGDNHKLKLCDYCFHNWYGREREVKFECSSCSFEWETQSEASDCCKSGHLTCWVCGEDHHTITSIKSCCLATKRSELGQVWRQKRSYSSTFLLNVLEDFGIDTIPPRSLGDDFVGS